MVGRVGGVAMSDAGWAALVVLGSMAFIAFLFWLEKEQP